MQTFMSRDKCLECLPSPFTYSCQTTCKTLDSFINWACGKLSHIQCDFSKTDWASDECFKKLRASLPRHDISIPLKFRELLGDHCSFSSICRQFSWSHCWETRAMRAEPHASCWICHSVWQQSVARFNELWEHKLINNFNYYLQQQIDVIVIKAGIKFFVEINEN